MLTTVLLDVDGTIIDSNHLHAKAWSKDFKEFGYPLSEEQTFPYIGMGADHLMPALHGPEPETELGQRLKTYRQELFLNNFAHLARPFSDTVMFLDWLETQPFKTLIATSANAEELEAMLLASHLAGRAIERVTAKEGQPSKPSPNIILTAIKQARCKSKETLLIGDTPYDISAAHSAGARCIAVLTGGRFRNDLAKADLIVTDLTELKVRWSEVVDLFE